MFDELKAAGEVKLIARAGKCNSNACSNKGKKGFLFLAPLTNKRLDFVFKSENDCLKDVFHCNGFCQTKEDANEKSELIIIDFFDEDSVDFKPDDFYIAYQLPCSKAVDEANELINKKGNLTVDDCIYLFEKYDELFENAQEEAGEIAEFELEFYAHFFYSFQNFSVIVKQQQYEADALQALDDYNKFADNDYEALRNWIIDCKSLLDNVTEAIHLNLYRDFVITEIYNSGQYSKCMAEIKSDELIKQSNSYKFYITIDKEMNDWHKNGGRHFEEKTWQRAWHNY